MLDRESTTQLESSGIGYPKLGNLESDEELEDWILSKSSTMMSKSSLPPDDVEPLLHSWMKVSKDNRPNGTTLSTQVDIVHAV